MIVRFGAIILRGEYYCEVPLIAGRSRIIERSRRMSRVGGLTKKFYRETRGIKVSGGQFVKAGTVLTRKGDRWKCGINVSGRMHLTALCDGEVYFTKKRGNYKRTVTFVHVRPLKSKQTKKVKREA